MSKVALVRAAGGVVVRKGAGRETQVLLVYRSSRGDWTFPKGKVESGETDEACALREVEEETGLRCVLTGPLPPSVYVDRKGRDKIVRYWMMQPLGGEAAPRNEIDAVRWVSIAHAFGLLTHDRDRALLDHAALRAISQASR